MAKWTLENEPELVPVEVDPSHYQSMLAELAEILYQFAKSCQLEGGSDTARPLDPASSTALDTSRHDSGNHEFHQEVG